MSAGAPLDNGDIVPFSGYAGVCASNVSLTPDSNFSDIAKVDITLVSTDINKVYDDAVTAIKDRYVEQGI